MRFLLTLIVSLGCLSSFGSTEDLFENLRQSAIAERENSTTAVANSRAPRMAGTLGLTTPVFSGRLGVGLATDILYTSDRSSEIYFGAMLSLSVAPSTQDVLAFVVPSLLYRSTSFRNANPFFGLGAGIALDSGIGKFTLLVRPGLTIGRETPASIETALGIIDTGFVFMPRLSLAFE